MNRAGPALRRGRSRFRRRFSDPAFRPSRAGPLPRARGSDGVALASRPRSGHNRSLAPRAVPVADDRDPSVRRPAAARRPPHLRGFGDALLAQLARNVDSAPSPSRRPRRRARPPPRRRTGLAPPPVRRGGRRPRRRRGAVGRRPGAALNRIRLALLADLGGPGDGRADGTELGRLAAAAADGTATADDRIVLESLLLHDAAAQRFFGRYAALDADLRRAFGPASPSAGWRWTCATGCWPGRSRPRAA